MGSKAREILGVKPEEVVKLLNKALADEWLAYYQYWVGAKLAKGPMRGAVAAELEQHASEELAHAEKLAERIIQLGGTPLISPQEWFKQTGCGYDAPADPHVATLLKQNIKGEQCAIETYKNIAEFLQGKDLITFHIVMEILEDEIEHEEDLEALEEDLKIMASK